MAASAHETPRAGGTSQPCPRCNGPLRATTDALERAVERCDTRACGYRRTLEAPATHAASSAAPAALRAPLGEGQRPCPQCGGALTPPVGRGRWPRACDACDPVAAKNRDRERARVAKLRGSAPADALPAAPAPQPVPVEQPSGPRLVVDAPIPAPALSAPPAPRAAPVFSGAAENAQPVAAPIIDVVDAIDAWGLSFHVGTALQHLVRGELEAARACVDREIARQQRRAL